MKSLLPFTSCAVWLGLLGGVAQAGTILVGEGGLPTVQAAIAAVPDESAERSVIHIKPGTYQGQIIVPASKKNVFFEGEDARTTILTFALNSNEENPPGVDPRYKGTGVVVLGDDFRAEKITFQNTSGDHGQALALRIDGDRAVVRDCRLLGWQDTLMVNKGRQYFRDSTIEGRVDFIYGSGTTVFDGCEIKSKNGGHITAASTPEEQPFGFVFLGCDLTESAEPWIDPATEQPMPGRKVGALADLGRPWRPYAAVTYINCRMGSHILPEGWNNWRKVENEKTARYSEFGSITPEGKPVDVSKRFAWTRQLSAEEAKAITLEEVFRDWSPQIVAATNVAATNIAVPPLANGKVLAFERIAALPSEQKNAWNRYLERSETRLRADKAVLETETRASGLTKPIAAPEGPTFKLDPDAPADGYRSDAARRIADAMISFQTPGGGWSKAVAYSKGPRQPGMHWANRADGWSFVSTFDNRATTEQIAFLARVHEATNDPKYAIALQKGLDFVLEAQFPNGGWPQIYPLVGGYHDNATFNDDMMVHILHLLRDVAEEKPPYAFADEARRVKARDAVDGATRFLVNSQVVQGGKRTVWGAQHDPLSLIPALARSYELPSLSGGESIGLTRFLMSLDKPSPEVIEAVQSAVAWFDSVKISGIEVVKKPDPTLTRGFDTVVIPNPAAPPNWARFYELETHRPIFVGRDGIVKYNLAEIDAERRTGYAWYQPKPKDLLEKDYPRWQTKWAPGKNVLSR